MGLIQREIEKAGVSTIGISMVRRFTEAVKPPRTLLVPFPFGHPLGNPLDVVQQKAVLKAALAALCEIHTAGQIFHYT